LDLSIGRTAKDTYNSLIGICRHSKTLPCVRPLDLRVGRACIEPLARRARRASRQFQGRAIRIDAPSDIEAQIEAGGDGHGLSADTREGGGDGPGEECTGVRKTGNRAGEQHDWCAGRCGGRAHAKGLVDWASGLDGDRPVQAMNSALRARNINVPAVFGELLVVVPVDAGREQQGSVIDDAPAGQINALVRATPLQREC
jgi:hypothetical protein